MSTLLGTYAGGPSDPPPDAGGHPSGDAARHVPEVADPWHLKVLVVEDDLRDFDWTRCRDDG